MSSLFSYNDCACVPSLNSSTCRSVQVPQKTILPCPYISVSFSCCNVLLSCSTSSGLPPRENLLSLSSTRRPSLSASSFTSQVRRRGERGSKLPYSFDLVCVQKNGGKIYFFFLLPRVHSCNMNKYSFRIMSSYQQNP